MKARLQVRVPANVIAEIRRDVRAQRQSLRRRIPTHTASPIINNPTLAGSGASAGTSVIVNCAPSPDKEYAPKWSNGSVGSSCVSPKSPNCVFMKSVVQCDAPQYHIMKDLPGP